MTVTAMALLALGLASLPAAALAPACGAPTTETESLSAAPEGAPDVMCVEHMTSRPTGAADSVALVDIAKNDPMPPPTLRTGNLTHPVHANDEAQKWFNQGLRLLYAFNMREALRAFRYAHQNDSDCVMCRWGTAMAVSVNINQRDQPEPDLDYAVGMLNDTSGFENAPLVEQRLVLALLERFGKNDTQEQRNVKYADAMTQLACEFPDDPDIQTLYIDAVMNIKPWGYWDLHGYPSCECAEPICGRIEPAVKTLGGGLDTNPGHMGYVHWGIHLLEGSSHPEVMETFADSLSTVAESSSHLIHMPSHLYYRIGRHIDSVNSNYNAYAADEVYFREVPLNHTEGDRFRYGYMRHNVHFMLASAVMTGRTLNISTAAEDLLETEGTNISYRTDLYRSAVYQGYSYLYPPLDLLQVKRPPSDLGFAVTSWDYIQALGLTRLQNETGAQEALDDLKKHGAEYRSMYTDQRSDCIVTQIMELVAEARLNELRGRLDDGLDLLKHAESLQGSMSYDEPPYWLVPVEQTEAALLIGNGSYLEAVERLHWSIDHGEPTKNLYTNFRNNSWAHFGLKTAYEGYGPDRLNQEQKADYQRALDGYQAYCPSDVACVISLERM